MFSVDRLVMTMMQWHALSIPTPLWDSCYNHSVKTHL